MRTGNAFGNFDIADEAVEDLISPRTVVPMQMQMGEGMEGQMQTQMYGEEQCQEQEQIEQQHNQNWFEQPDDFQSMQQGLDAEPGQQEARTTMDPQITDGVQGMQDRQHQHLTLSSLEVIVHNAIANITGECDRLHDLVSHADLLTTDGSSCGNGGYAEMSEIEQYVVPPTLFNVQACSY